MKTAVHSKAFGTFELTRTSRRVTVLVGSRSFERTVWFWDEDECTRREYALVGGTWHELSGSGPVRDVAYWEPVALPAK